MDIPTNQPRERYYVNGLLFSHYHGIRRTSGQLVKEFAFWNYPTGRRLAEGYFLDGVRCGKWREFAESGEVISTIDFGEGEYTLNENDIMLCDMSITPETCILIEEEYGYRYHFWFPDRHLPEIRDWWESQYSIEPFVTYTENARFTLPGYVMTVDEIDCDYKKWYELFDQANYWYCHFNDDDDSYLKTPSGDYIYNRSYEIIQQYELD